MKLLKVEHSVASPGALIGASNFFELAVAVAITLFGANSGAAIGHGGWRAGRSPGHAFRLQHVQSNPPLVRSVSA